MTRRILLGAFPDGGYGLRVSQAGYDVASNPVNNERLIFNSDWPAVLPIYLVGTLTLTAGQTQTVSFATLGYTPHFSALISRDSGANWQSYQMTNSFRLPKWSGTYTEYPSFPYNEIAYQGTGTYCANIQVRLFANSVTIYSDTAAQVAYTIYRIQGF